MHLLKICCVAIGIVLAMALNSLAGNTDLKWAAKWLLPYGQYETNKLAEWTSDRGYIHSSGNVVAVKLRFDQASIDTFSHLPFIGINRYAFGLEVEVVECSDSPQLEIKSIDNTFPSESKPIMDTNFEDGLTNDNKCVSNGKNPYVVGSLLLRDPYRLEKDTDYYVYFNLRDHIPEEGVNLHLNLQLTYDVDFAANSLKEVVDDYFGATCTLEAYDYFVVESDSYMSFTARSSGWKGVCWDSKTGSYECDVAEFIGICPSISLNKKTNKWFPFSIFSISEAFASDCISANRAEVGSFITGNLEIPLGYGDIDPEPTDPDYDPNIHINSLDIRFFG